MFKIPCVALDVSFSPLQRHHCTASLNHKNVLFDGASIFLASLFVVGFRSSIYISYLEFTGYNVPKMEATKKSGRKDDTYSLITFLTNQILFHLWVGVCIPRLSRRKFLANLQNKSFLHFFQQYSLIFTSIL